MGNTIAFDTHAYVKKLRDAGVDERQAEVQAEALVDLVEDRLATKRDIADLKRDIKELDTKTETRFKELDTKAEIRFKELDAKTEIRFKELDTKAETRFKELDAKTETRFKELDTKAETRFRELDTNAETRFRELDTNAETRFRELNTKAETRSRETDAKLKELELRMVIKTGGMVLAGIGILFGLMRAWPLPVQFVPVPGQEMRQTAPPFPPGR